MKKIPTVFISYSWENDEQKDWVAKLANHLRKKGIDATLDVFETQKGTTNLNAMMVEKIKDSDYTIIILTDKYVEKADEMQGGVGYETSMLLSYMQENLHKIIPIKTQWNSKGKVPFYLGGVHYIDFSKSQESDEKFKELLHRIFQVDLIEKEPLGNRPELSPRKLGDFTESSLDDLIPDLREITDMDKTRFMQESFTAIKGGILQLLRGTKSKNSNFDFIDEDTTNHKTIFRMYIDGNQSNAFSIWIDNAFGSSTDSIKLSYGQGISGSDSSFNEFITCEVSSDKELSLKMHMNMYGNREANTPELIIIEIWKQIMN